MLTLIYQKRVIQKEQVDQEYVTISKKLDIPKDKLHEYKEEFDIFDKNKKGRLSIGEITKIMKNFGCQMAKEEARSMKSCHSFWKRELYQKKLW